MRVARALLRHDQYHIQDSNFIAIGFALLKIPLPWPDLQAALFEKDGIRYTARMQRARKSLKIIHSVAASGMIGGLGCYMVLLMIGVPETPAEYADLRSSITLISNYILLPSFVLVAASGLLSMVVHEPFINKGWVWLKAMTGILLFEGVLGIVGAKASIAEQKAEEIAAGTAPADALESLLALEWGTLAIVMVISVLNVILGVWRPRRITPDFSWEKDEKAATMDNQKPLAVD
ncbi:MAG: DUF2269 family protein [Pseudomonadota bacterium]